MLFLGRLESVGIGMVICSVMVGSVHGLLTRAFGAKRDALLAGG